MPEALVLVSTSEWSVLDHLLFHVAYEPLCMHVVGDVLHAVEQSEFDAFLAKKRNRSEEERARRVLAFLYELLHGECLTLPTWAGEPVSLLDSQFYFTTSPKSAHYRYSLFINTPFVSPLLLVCARSTHDGIRKPMGYADDLIRQSVKCSYKIEGDPPPSPERVEKLLDVLNSDSPKISDLYHAVKESGDVIRKDDVVVASSERNKTSHCSSISRDKIHHVGMPPSLLANVLNPLQGLIDEISHSSRADNSSDPVPELALALSAFYAHIHPHSDGNGRVSRVLMEVSGKPARGVPFSVILDVYRQKSLYDDGYCPRGCATVGSVMDKYVKVVDGRYVVDDVAAEQSYLWHWYDASYAVKLWTPIWIAAVHLADHTTEGFFTVTGGEAAWRLLHEDAVAAWLCGSSLTEEHIRRKLKKKGKGLPLWANSVDQLVELMCR